MTPRAWGAAATGARRPYSVIALRVRLALVLLTASLVSWCAQASASPNGETLPPTVSPGTAQEEPVPTPDPAPVPPPPASPAPPPPAPASAPAPPPAPPPPPVPQPAAVAPPPPSASPPPAEKKSGTPTKKVAKAKKPNGVGAAAGSGSHAVPLHPPVDRPATKPALASGNLGSRVASVRVPAQSARPRAGGTPAASSSDDRVRALLVSGLAVAFLLIALSAIPPSAIRAHKAGVVLAAHRDQIGITGVSTLLALGIAFLIQHSNL